MTQAAVWGSPWGRRLPGQTAPEEIPLPTAEPYPVQAPAFPHPPPLIFPSTFPLTSEGGEGGGFLRYIVRQAPWHMGKERTHPC